MCICSFFRSFFIIENCRLFFMESYFTKLIGFNVTVTQHAGFMWFFDSDINDLSFTPKVACFMQSYGNDCNTINFLVYKCNNCLCEVWSLAIGQRNWIIKWFYKRFDCCQISSRCKRHNFDIIDKSHDKLLITNSLMIQDWMVSCLNST